MGYYSTYDGNITIENKTGTDHHDIHEAIERLITPELISASSNVSTRDGGTKVEIDIYNVMKWYDWVADLTQFADELTKAGYTVNGYIDRQGEENDDHDALSIENGVASVSVRRGTFATDEDIRSIIEAHYAEGVDALVSAVASIFE